MRAALLAALALAAPAAARADDAFVTPAADAPAFAAPGAVPIDPPPAAPAPRHHRWQVSAQLALRSTALADDGRRFPERAAAYGWRSAAARPLLGGSIDASYLHAPILDLGVTASWMEATFAAGVDPDDQLSVSTVGIGATARVHWAQGRPFMPEPRLELGLLRERTDVHGTPHTRLHRYFRAGVDWRLGTRTAGVTLALGFTMIDHDADETLAPPLGGLDLAAGPYFRF